MVKGRVCKRCGKLAMLGEECCQVKRIDTRESAHKRGYDKAWENFRRKLWDKWIREGRVMVCADCKRRFRDAMPHFDHIVPVQSRDDPAFFDEANIQLLHAGCHAKKTRKDMQDGTTRKR